MLTPITIRTLGDLIDNGIGIWAHCDGEYGCGHRAMVDVRVLAERLGRDFVHVRARLPLKCSVCGSREVSTTIEVRAFRV